MASLENVSAKRLHFRKAGIIVAFGVAIAIATTFGYRQYKRAQYPYGTSHCCSKQLGLALRMYADDHGGKFPTGEKTPEASLSLLYSNYADADLLRGKTVPLEITTRILESGGKLGPESCGWHYVEGLTESNYGDLAIAWDKVGLGHNGERLRFGGHEVIYVLGNTDIVPASKWDEFLVKQRGLLNNRDELDKQGVPSLTARIQMPDGKLLDSYDGRYEIRRNDGSQGGSRLRLTWSRLYGRGKVQWILILPDERLRSKPVEFSVENGRATPSKVIFEMEPF
jgi:hypothetical protein